MNSKPNLLIVVVEDDDIDQEFLKRTFRTLDRVALKFFGTAEDALLFLRQQGDDCPPSRRIVFLDINLPGMSGLDFLHELRADERVKNTAVLVLSSSDDPRDIAKAFSYNVAGYILKSDAGEKKQEILQLCIFYRDVSLFPSDNPVSR
jgi:CheY-like chemotaxis protein